MAEKAEFTGVVETVLGNNNYRIRVVIGEEERIIRCHLNGKMRLHRITVIPGDRVLLELPPPFDIGRITRRVQ